MSSEADPLAISPPRNAFSNGGSDDKLYSLRWNNFQTHFTQKFMKVLIEEEFTDVILAAEGQYIKSHKLILSMCSPYLKRLMNTNTPADIRNGGTTIIILNNVKYQDLEKVIEFIYSGEIKVAESDLKTFLQTGELLEIEGLCKSKDPENSNPEPSNKSAIRTLMKTSQIEIIKPTPVTTTTHSSSLLLHTFRPHNIHNENVDEVLNHPELEDCDLEIEEIEEDPEYLLSEVDVKEELSHFEVRGDSLNENLDEYEFNNSKAFYPETMPTQNDHQEIIRKDVHDGRIGTLRNTRQRVVNSPPKRLAALRNSLVNTKRKNSQPQSKSKRSIVKTKVDMTKFRQCPFCPLLVYRSNMSRHVSQAHTQDLLRQGKKLFKCLFCTQIYRSDQALKLHKEKNHPNGA